MSRASLDKDPRDVAAMFDDVASKYDVTNDVLSLGQDRLWRRAVVQACEAVPGQVVLDIAAGTGTSSEPFADSGVDVVQTAIDQERTSTARAHIGADGSATYDFDLSWEFARAPRTDGFGIVHVGSVGALRPPGAHRVVELVEALVDLGGRSRAQSTHAGVRLVTNLLIDVATGIDLHSFGG